MCNGCGSYPHVQGKTRMNVLQASYLVSIRLITDIKLEGFRNRVPCVT